MTPGLREALMAWRRLASIEREMVCEYFIAEAQTLLAQARDLIADVVDGVAAR